MAQRFLGIEIGTRTVRVVRLTSSGRGFVADLYREQPIPSGEGGGPDGVEAALKSLRLAGVLTGETSAVNVPGGAAMVIELQLPFAERKAIEAILPAQLAGRLPITDEHTVDFAVIGPNTTSPELFDILVVAYPKALCAARLETLADHGGIDPQFALPLTLLEHRAARFLMPDPNGGVYALVDLGARATRITVMDGTRFVSSREVLVGGDAVTDLLAEELDLGHEAAEALKRERGFVAPTAQEETWYQQLLQRGTFERDPGDDPVRIAQSARFALTPVVVGLRQMLSSFTLSSGRPVERIVLCGGGAWLHGLAPYLSEEIGVSCQPVRIEQPELASVAPNPLARPEMIGALSLALCAAELHSGGLELNLRRGELAYRGSLEFLREHALSFAVLLVLLVGAAAFAIWMQFRALDVERDQLKAALGTATQQTFGKQLFTQSAIEAEIRGADSFGFLPSATAFDIFTGLSEAATNQLADVDFEFSKLDINMVSGNLQYTADTNEDDAIRRITAAVASHPCISDEIPEPKTKRVRGRVDFTVRVGATDCRSSGETALAQE